MPRELKITLGAMRRSGPRRLQVFCGDYRCAHSVVVNADAAETWFEENDPEGVAFEYEVLE